MMEGARRAPYPLGTTFLPGGVAFSVWAPNAESVSVVGTWNAWSPLSHPLEKEEGGIWGTLVPEAVLGHEYRYSIQSKVKQARISRIDPRALKLSNCLGNGVLWHPPTTTTTDDTTTKPTTANAPLNLVVIYEMHIGTFNVSEKMGPGSFASAIEKLPYLRELGVNAIEVMPVTEFPGPFSWGYNSCHPWAVSSAYGGPEGFLAFVESSHKHGIAVFLDVVYNHFGPSDLALWQFDGWSENGLGGIYFYNDWRAKTPWGDSRPDYGRGEVRTYIRDNAIMWATVYGIDGLRCDSTIYMRSYLGIGPPIDQSDDLREGWTLCQWLNDELRAHNKHFVTIAEDSHKNSWVVKTTGEGGAGFSAQWNGSFAHPVRTALMAPSDQQRDLNAIVAALKAPSNQRDAFQRVIFTESHDEVANGGARMPTAIDSGSSDSFAARKRSILGAVLVFTAPGIPMMFQGQEFLEDGWFRDHVPLDWAKLEGHHEIHALYKDLIALRLNRTGVSKGLSGLLVEVNHVDHGNKVLGFRRWCEGEANTSVLVVLNFSTWSVGNYDIGVPMDGEWIVRFNSDGKKYSADFTNQGPSRVTSRPHPLDGYCDRITIALAPYSAIILSQ